MTYELTDEDYALLTQRQADLDASVERAGAAIGNALRDVALAHDALGEVVARATKAVPPPPPVDPYLPARYATVDEARAALGAPADANYVVWNHGTKMLEEVFASLGANDILVLPERPEPYLIDSSKGFMAAGVTAVDGPAGKTPVVSNPRLWFAMARARRGILGLGPGVVIQPSPSTWTAPAQPKPMNAYMSNGSSMVLSGCQNKLIESEKSAGFFANFTLRGRDFGGVAYSGLNGRTFVRVHVDGGWRGFAGVPNGETGAFTLLGGEYRIESCTLRSENGPSPIMWNNTAGGTVKHLKTTIPNHGMLTFWRSAGVNRFEDVHMEGRSMLVNLEQVAAGFSLDWQGGSGSVIDATSGVAYHVNGNPSNGSFKVALRDVKISGGRDPGKLTAHVYTTANVQRKSDITWDGGQVAYYGQMVP